MVKKIAEKFNRLSRVHQRHRWQTDRQTTDGRPIAYSKRNVIRWRLLKMLKVYARFHFSLRMSCFFDIRLIPSLLCCDCCTSWNIPLTLPTRCCMICQVAPAYNLQHNRHESRCFAFTRYSIFYYSYRTLLTLGKGSCHPETYLWSIMADVCFGTEI